MKPQKARAAAPKGPRLLEGFETIETLWQGNDPPYPSEQSARWGLRQLRQELLDAGALAFHRGRLFVHRERHRHVAEQHAIAAARARAAA